VDFWATWCGPCRALTPILEKLVAEFKGAFVLAKVDTDKEQALSNEFQIRSIPTVMLFRNGNVVTGFQGAQPEGNIRRFLAQNGIEPGGGAVLELSADPVERLAQLRTAVAASPERDSLKLELATAVLAVGDLDEATRLLEALPATVYGDVKAVRARARLGLMRRVARGEGDTRYLAGVQSVLSGDTPAGLESLLDVLREQKHDEESPARAALVEAFQLIEDDALVREWRRRMATVLF
jgi:putative thioredoxin